MRTPATIGTAVLLCVVALCFTTTPVFAGEVAILRNGFSIPHDHRTVTGDTTRLYLSADESSFTDVATADITGFEKDLTLPVPSAISAQQHGASSASERPHVDLDQVVNSASAAYHLDPDLVNSVIHAESGFNSHAVSPKGARGLMQLMPSTANDLGVSDVFDSEANVGGGSHYLRELLERYDFDLVKALAAYNAGPQRVDRYHGVPPFSETRAYVARIVHDYNRKKIAQEKAAQDKAAQAQKKHAAAATRTSAPSTPSPRGSKRSSPASARSVSGRSRNSARSAAQLAANPLPAASAR
ncbi:MAG: lytic transglycosylase domain-containing protein [Terriglobales bacterium]